MLGKTAGGLFWMFRFMERSENIARLVDAGFRISLTRSTAAESEWASVVATAGATEAYFKRYDEMKGAQVVDFLLRDRSNPSSVLSVIDNARNNARLVRTALTREVWEATNECWMNLKATLARPVSEVDLPDALSVIRQQSALVRGALIGTMLRNDIYNFANIGTFIERADNTARILDVKYYVLLPSISAVGSALDNVQWETILRSLSALHAYRWLSEGEANAMGIANFLILDGRMPRSLAFCSKKINESLKHLADNYNCRNPSHDMADRITNNLSASSIETIFENGLHEFLKDFIIQNNCLGRQIEQDFRFNG
jgi:uncharacterized alpha-E superfamily protein